MAKVILKHRGDALTSLKRTHGGTLNYQDDGSVEAVEIFHCLWTKADSLMPRRNYSKHPDFSSLLCASSKATRLKPGTIARIEVTYKGFLREDPTENEENEYVQELVASTRQEPIESHKDFTSAIGGTAANPLNDAIFDEDGKFTGFKASSKYAGVKSYLVCGTTYRLRRSSAGRPGSIRDVGTRSSPSVGVGAPGGTNWLFIARTWTRSGGVYSINEEWQLSGPKGWDATIYP